MYHLLLELEQARTIFVLCGDIHISGLLNDLMASHYCLEFPVCMYAHSLEQGHLFLSPRKTVVAAPTLRQFAVGHVMRSIHV